MMSEEIYEWGLSVIAAVQKIKSPFMTAFMEGVSFFGDPIFYLIVVALMFWCIDSRKGFKLGTVIIFSGALNSAIKQTLQVPRPFVRDPSVFVVEESGFSTPSGHSQGSASFYPVASSVFVRGKNIINRATRILLATLAPLLIGFSRIYLGVHYPTDVLLGLTIGFLTATGTLLFWDDVEKKLAPLRKSLKILILAFVCLVLNYFCDNDTSMSGLLFGFVGGNIFMNEKHGFDASSGTFTRKILRLVLGLAVVALVYGLLKMLFSFVGWGTEQSELYSLCRFIRYCTTGIAASCIAPMLFVRMNLAACSTRSKED